MPRRVHWFRLLWKKAKPSAAKAMKLVESCKKKCHDIDDPRAVNEAELNWSNRGFMNWAVQAASLANAKG